MGRSAQLSPLPTTVPVGDQQAFTPAVAVNSAGAVAVTYYDFRNNTDLTPGSGLPTDYFIAVNPDPVGNPSNWTEAKLTDTSFNMENAARTSRGYFLGDYQGLAAAGQNFDALFGQAGADSTDPSNIWFRDPPPAPEAATHYLSGDDTATATAARPSLTAGAAADLFGDLGATVAGRPDTGGARPPTEGSGRLAGALQNASIKPSLADLGAAGWSGGVREMADLDPAFVGLGNSSVVDAQSNELDSAPTD